MADAIASARLGSSKSLVMAFMPSPVARSRKVFDAMAAFYTNSVGRARSVSGP